MPGVGLRLYIVASLLLLQLLLSTPSAQGSFEQDTKQLQGSTTSRIGSLQQHAQKLLHKCPLPGYCIRDQGLPGPADYLSSNAGHAGMQRQRHVIAEFLKGSGFQARLQQLQQFQDRRGILISAGKPHHIGNAAVMLHVLRRQYNCTLPVEIAHRGDAEVDSLTRATLAAAFSPLRWLDLNQQPYPAHHNQDYSLDRYEPKIYALYHTSFQQVLMLDADNMPLRDPAYLFDSPHMSQHGAMMWLDLWSPELSRTTFVGHDSVYPLVGFRKQPYWDALAGGQGYVRRVAESGQLLLDRVRHADVLEWLWMYTSYSRDLYKHILGDKDTFGYAFAAAGKLHDLHAVAVPPGIALVRTPTAGAQLDWWHFHAMTQYDHLGGVVFFHRTFEKWMDVRQMPTLMDVQTGPLPNWFISSYLGNRSTGLTPDIPGHVLQPLAPPPSCSSKTPTSTYLHNGSYTKAHPLNLNIARQRNRCPLGVYLQVLELRALGLPVAENPELDQACRRHVALMPHSLRVLQSDIPARVASARDLLQGRPASGHADKAGSSILGVAPDHFFALMNERVWLRNCVALRKTEGFPQSISSSSSIATTNSDLKASAGHKLLLTPVQHHSAASMSSSSRSGVRRHHRLKQKAPSTWPQCNEVNWHVARYILPEYAQQVGEDANGQPMAHATAVLPVVQLVSSSSPYDPAEVGKSTSVDSRGAVVAGPSCGSCVDVLQRVSLPAAVQWLINNLEHLPYLQTEADH